MRIYITNHVLIQASPLSGSLFLCLERKKEKSVRMRKKEKSVRMRKKGKSVRMRERKRGGNGE